MVSCFTICLLRRHTIASKFPLFEYLLIASLLCSMFRLSRLLFVTSPWFLLKVSIGSFIICLLCHSCALDFDCLFLCLLRHYAFYSWFPLFHYLLVISLYDL